MRRVLAGWAVLAAALAAPRGAAAAPSEPVQGIRIEGLKTVSEPFLRSRLQTAVGVPLDDAILDADIGRLYQTGYFAEVRVHKEVGPGGLILRFEVVENPLVSEVRFYGNDAFSDRKLRDLAFPFSSKQGEILFYFAPSDLQLGIQAIREAYKEKAYVFVQVRAHLEPAASGQRVIIQIDEGRRVPVRKVSLRGNDSYRKRWPSEWRESKIRKGAPILTKKKLLFFRPGTLDLEVLRDDADRIRDFYRANGWLDAEVKAGHQIDVQKGRTEVSFEIAEGERYRIGTVALFGNRILTAEDLLPRFRVQSGRPYLLKDVVHDEEAIKTAYGDQGYLVTQVVPRYHYDTVGKVVDVTFEIEEGPKVRIRRLEVEGNTKTRDKVLRREMTLHPGDLFNYSRLKRSQKKIHNLRYFDTLRVRLDEVGDPEQRDLVLDVQEGKTGRFNYGAGFSSDFGVFGIVRISQSNYDLADLRGFPGNTGDFFLGDAYVGGGQNFFASATPGQRLTSYDLGYSEPWLYDYPVGLAGNLFLRTRNYFDYVVQDRGGTLTLSRRFGEFWKLGGTLAASEVEVSSVAVDAPQIIRDSEGVTAVYSIAPFLIWDTRDDPYSPASGQMNQVTYQYGGNPIFPGVDFWRLSDTYQRFWTLKQNEDEERKHIVSFAATAGMIEPHSQTGEVPIFLKYFAGGATTIRGFDFNAVGPKQNGTVVGGDFQFLTNLEYTHPIYEEILRGAVFVDRGTVEPSIRDSDLTDAFRSSYGFGLRIRLPIAPTPVSLDVAFPLESEDDDDLRVFTLNFGGVF